MKRSIKALLITLFFFASSSYINAAEKNAIMQEKFEDPLAFMEGKFGADHIASARNKMGANGKIVEYRHCIQNISWDKATFKDMEKEMVNETAENGKYNDIKSVTLIDKCPLPADAGCDHGNMIEYFYTDSSKLLEEQKEGCEYFKKKWSSNIKDIDDTKIIKEESEPNISKDAHLINQGQAVILVENKTYTLPIKICFFRESDYSIDAFVNDSKDEYKSKERTYPFFRYSASKIKAPKETATLVEINLVLENEDITNGGVIYSSRIINKIPYDLFDGKSLHFTGQIDRYQFDTTSKKVAIEITVNCK